MSPVSLTHPITALIVDDNLDFIDAATRFLEAGGPVEVIGHAHCGQDAIQQVAALHPDLVLMDWAMPGMTGLEATRQLKAQSAWPTIVILTQHDSPRYQHEALAAGADAFLIKSDIGAQLLSVLGVLFHTSRLALNAA